MLLSWQMRCSTWISVLVRGSVSPEGEIERSRRREDEEVIEPIPLIVDGVDQEISSPFSASSLGILLPDVGVALLELRDL